MLYEKWACDIFLNFFYFFCYIIQRFSYTQVLLKCPKTVWGHHIIYPSIYCTCIACHISHFCMGFISLNGCVSEKETQSARQLSLLNSFRSHEQTRILWKRFYATAERRQTDRCKDVSLFHPLLREQVYGFDIDISDSLLNPSIKKNHPCISAFSTARRFLMWVVRPGRERERARDTSLLSCF